MRVVHFSITPLAGAPIRLVQALCRHTDVDARLVDLSRWGYFDHDVVWDETPDAAVELARAADVIHLHNYLDLTSRQFAPIDLAACRRRGAAVVRHFHSHPAVVAKAMGTAEAELAATDLPSMVVGQFQERFYPAAHVVPNILPVDDPAYLPSDAVTSGEVMLAYAPAYARVGAWDNRWNTKAVPETLRMLRRLRRRCRLTVRQMCGVPLADILNARRQAAIVLDEMVTGSYHLSGLEALAVGRPALAYLDSRCLTVLAEMAGTDECPFVNTHLADASKVLAGLLADPDRADRIGAAGRQWMRQHWSAERFASCFVDAYTRLLTDPAGLTRQEALRLDDPHRRRCAVTVPEMAYEAAAGRWAAAVDAARPAHQRLGRWLARACGRPVVCGATRGPDAVAPKGPDNA